MNTHTYATLKELIDTVLDWGAAFGVSLNFDNIFSYQKSILTNTDPDTSLFN